MRKKDKKSASGLVKVLCALLTASVLIITVLCLSNRDLQSEMALLERQINDPSSLFSYNEKKTLEDGNVYYSRRSMLSMAERATSLTEFMSMLYPDMIVYYDGSEIVYLPISGELKHSTYDTSLITDLPGGEKTYSDRNGITSLKGVDVSEWQDDVDWQKVKEDGVQFAFLRAGARGYTSGTVYEDVCIRKNLKGANAAGIPVGVYFYSMAVNEKEALEEADMVLDLIKGYDVTWPVVIDVEKEGDARTSSLTPTQRTDIIIAFCERVREAGYTPMIYCNMRMFVEKLELERLEGYEKWFAQYFSVPYYPYEFGIWQYTSDGNVDGIPGPADMNISFKDYGKTTD